MKTLILALSIMSWSVMAQEVIEISCESPGLTYLNRFELNEKVELDTDVTVTKLEDVSLRVYLTQRGNNSTSRWKTLSGLSGELKKVDSDFTAEPFYSLILKDEGQDVLVQLNVGYPQILNSQIRTKDGFVYKSGCSML